MDAERLKDALEDMVGQYAHHTVVNGRRAYTTGGMSALEHAFEALGWDEPHYTDDGECEIDGCNEWATCVAGYPRSLARPTREQSKIGFGFLCSAHYHKWNCKDAERPDDFGRVK